ncbi:hypothetical protein JI667_06750 [Bacillus sp. NTK074B]|nr:hypothetical protein [Bacillus sp. NTK074B]
MSEFHKAIIRLFERVAFLIIGFLCLFHILKPVYERFGIEFMGNVWINWFGISYILYVFYTLIASFFIAKENTFFQQRVSSFVFWILFIVANYVVFVPFVKGENPF